MDGAEEVLLDLNALAEGHTFLGARRLRRQRRRQLAGVLARHDRLPAVRAAREGPAHRARLGERIERVGSVVWATDNKTLFYTTEDAVSKRSDKVWRHAVGSGASELVFEETDELFDVSAGRSLDKKMIFIGSCAKTSTELRYLPRRRPDRRSSRVIVPRAARPRVRRRSLRRAALHPHQQGREELPGRHGADRRSVRAELDSRSSSTSRRSDRRHGVLRAARGGRRARRRPRATCASST